MLAVSTMKDLPSNRGVQWAIKHTILLLCIRLSKNNSNVRSKHTTCLKIIITQMKMTNRQEEPDIWAVIKNLDLEQET